MYTDMVNKLKADPRVAQAINASYAQKRKKLLLYAIAVLAFALLLCLLASFGTVECVITFALAAVAVIIPVLLLRYKRGRETVILGTVERIEENREIVPQKGSGVFGGNHVRTAEIYRLLVAITDEKGLTQVIFCPPQYEKLIKVGDTLLWHSALPYPAHLSNLTSCICMHCGTMQDANSRTCINCGATLYNFYSVTK